MRKRKVKRPHWYKRHIGECPVCGKDKSYRERIYGKKPKDVQKCIEYFCGYDGCIMV